MLLHWIALDIWVLFLVKCNLTGSWHICLCMSHLHYLSPVAALFGHLHLLFFPTLDRYLYLSILQWNREQVAGWTLLAQPVCVWDICELKWSEAPVCCPSVSANEFIIIFCFPSATQGIHSSFAGVFGIFRHLTKGSTLQACWLWAPQIISGERDEHTEGKHASWESWLTLWSCLHLPVGRCWENRLFLPPVTCCGCGYLFQTTNWQACYIDLFTLFYDKNDHVPWIIQSYMNHFAVLTVWPFSFDHCWFFHLQEGIKKSC